MTEENEATSAPTVAAVTLSHFQAQELLAARQAGASSIVVSPDLGLTTITTALDEDGAVFPTGERRRRHLRHA